MKTNDYLLTAATAGFSYLFFKQNAGINFLAFNLIFIGILIYRDQKLLHRKNWLWAAGLCLISSTGILIHSSALAVIANCFSLLLLSAFSFNKPSSAVFSFLFSCYSIGTSFIYVLIDASRRAQKNTGDGNGKGRGYKFLAGLGVLLLCILFFILYQQANPLFADNTKWINFDFISFPWIMFTLFGFFIVYGLFYHKTIEGIVTWENNLALTNQPARPGNQANHETERSAGTILFVFLNLMLIILNSGDVRSIWFNASLPKGISHSDFVHEGVLIIILSILIATALIMFLFRNDFSAIKRSKALKALVYLWIIQNLVMLFSTACRNQMYINTYDLTHMRIGVYVWLALATIGLIIMFIKILNERSNWFLVRKNVDVWFCALALSSLLNWDLLITRYNLENKPLARVDFDYLFSLSDSNIPELIQVTREKNFSEIQEKLRADADGSGSRYRSYPDLLNRKIRHFLRNHKADWQSWDLMDNRIFESLSK